MNKILFLIVLSDMISIVMAERTCNPVTLDFDTAPDGTILGGGTYAEMEWFEEYGLRLSATGALAKYPLLFDTSSAEDKAFGDTDLGNVLTLPQEDNGNTVGPDDSQESGTISFHFSPPVQSMQEIGLVGLDKAGTYLSIEFNDGGGKINAKSGEIAGLDNYAVQNVPINLRGVSQLTLHLPGSGAVTSLSFCQETLVSFRLRPSPPSETLRDLIASVSPDGGEALQYPSTPQHKALKWLQDNERVDNYNEHQKIQRYALATLYYSTNGDEWTHNDRWLTDVDECMWFPGYPGLRNPFAPPDPLVCDDGAIVQLPLPFNQLRGTLPPEISLLSSLEYLDLSNNELTGPVPEVIGQMEKLNELYLYRNSLTGLFTCPYFIDVCAVSCFDTIDSKCRSLE